MSSNTIEPTLSTIWSAIQECEAPSALVHRVVSSFVIDSREVTKGSCFVALRGEKRDGHEFIEDALTRGAAAVIAERVGLEQAGLDSSAITVRCDTPDGAHLVDVDDRPLIFIVDNSLLALQQVASNWRLHFEPRVIGVTGSVGKSTSKEMIAAVLRQRYATLKNSGNLNNEIGLPLTILELRGTHQHAVLEMGMYQVGEIASLAAIARPQVGVITNVGPTHLERLQTIERVAQAKAELVQALPADGVAVLNGDDPLVRPMSSLTQARVFTYGLTADCDLWASHIVSQGLEGIRFRFHHQGETLHVKVPLLGRHSVHTALRAAAVGLVEGLNWEEIITGLQDVSSQLRLLVVPGINGATLLDDTYNASPASTLAALNLLEELEGRRIAVLGDMLELGTYEEAGHRTVGCRAAAVVQLLIAVGSRARWIASEAQACGLAAGAVHAVDSNDEVLAILRDQLREDDLVLVKGSRGMVMEQIVGALTAPPSEHQERARL